ncbi:MAG: hypothetical protein IT424_04800 [Pirellulales bacterium]|nr:hypothetical protein [Pirellulales bacterium]
MAAMSLWAAGCQSFSPAGLGGSLSEKKIRQQAEVDPFPTPADVGLGAATETK